MFTTSSSNVFNNNNNSSSDTKNPHQQQQQQQSQQRQYPIFAVSRMSHEIMYTPATTQLLTSIGGYNRIRGMTTTFYKLFERDPYLRQFLGRVQVPLECHAARLAKYICEQMGQQGEPWTADIRSRPRQVIYLANGETSVVTSRAGAHFCAWNSIDRPKQLVGRRFKLDDCRVWMRLLFCAARESGFSPIENHKDFPATYIPPTPTTTSTTSTSVTADSASTSSSASVVTPDQQFFHFLIDFIAHFIAIYEETARAFAKNEAMWAFSSEAAEKMLKQNRKIDAMEAAEAAEKSAAAAATAVSSSSTTVSKAVASAASSASAAVNSSTWAPASTNYDSFFMRDVVGVPYASAIAQVPPHYVIRDSDLYRGAEI